MKQKHWEFLGFWGVALLMLIATMIIIRWIVSFVTWSALDSGWAQAIGGIAAIAASFGFFYNQQRAENLRSEAESVFTTARAVIGVHTLCQWAVEAMDIAFEQMECQHSSGVIPFVPERFDELRQLFSQFVDPSSNLVVLQTALGFSNLLMEAKHDFPIASDEGLRQYVLDRSQERITSARALADLLKQQRDELLEACSRYGVNPVAGPLRAPPVPDPNGS